MEQFNYHKLVNLRKRFAKYDCPCSEELKAVIDKHMVLQKEASKVKTAKIKEEYQNEKVECPFCDKEQYRHYLYKHKVTCGMNPKNRFATSKPTPPRDALLKKLIDDIHEKYPEKKSTINI
tara:strand:- start:206 stop:568 length:363 start_codon:yes stop_codon:yes gene_type:complete